MSQFEEVDPTLVDWAERNSLRWYPEYQSTEVRSFYVNPESRGRVQVAVDTPQGGHTVVRIGQLPRGLSRLARTMNFPTPISDLSSALDTALKTANEWVAEEDLAGR